MAAGTPDEAYPLRAPDGEQALHGTLWQRITDEVAGQPDEASAPRPDEIPEPSTPRRRSAKRRLWLRFSVAATVLFTVSLLLYWGQLPTQPRRTALSAYVRHDVPHGRKTKLTLPDGTTVHLNAGSTLRYPARFDEDQRHVVLAGEGYFDVMNDADRPFIVSFGKTQVQVLGTRFNVREQAGLGICVTVEEGRVRFSAEGVADTLLLTANMQGIFTGDAMDHATVNSADFTGWTQGTLFFNAVRLAEAIPELERWYGVRFTLKDGGLAGYRIKARFDNAPLSTVLHDLAFALDIQYTIKDKEVILYK